MSRAAAEASGVNWLGALKRLASVAAGGASGPETGSGSAPPESAARPPPPRIPVPVSLQAAPLHRQAEAACSLAALNLCPDMAQAWLQWGNQLYAWTRERRLAAAAAGARSAAALGGATGNANGKQPAGTPKPSPSLAMTSADVEGYAASAEV